MSTAELIDTGLVRTAVEIKGLDEATCMFHNDTPASHLVKHGKCEGLVCTPCADYSTKVVQIETKVNCNVCRGLNVPTKTVTIRPI